MSYRWKRLMPTLDAPRRRTVNEAAVAAARAALPASFRPTWDEAAGRWRRPALSARRIAMLRSAAVAAGRPWPWDVPHRVVVSDAPFKGHMRERRWAERQAEIARSMARMPAAVAAFRKAERARRAAAKIKPGLLDLLTRPRVLEIAGDKGRKGKGQGGGAA
eukprot:TRINITY_DN20853_c0_g1_i1.p3 TRINITY_DN20853_c0_g1~~TRINITY_DN20853_c0_g1_i1.p3  ORF type:complete len:162 (+),score=50.46 TRINITY_DN20853_c0_g1_i1:139-624(+)